MSDIFDRVLAELQEATGYAPRVNSQGRAKAMCPAHEDNKASLVVRDDVDAGLVGFTCFAGCTFEEISKAIDLKPIELRSSSNGHRRRTKTPDPPPTPPSDGEKEVARYPYTDDHGTILYYNVRYEPKDFRMADKTGKVKQLPKNLVRVPYNLVEVKRAVAARRAVYWVEGEKDVHTLANLGEVGTTSAGGASSPVSPDWAHHFEDAHVVVVCDRDPSGRSYGRNVARMLINVAASVRLTEPATPQVKSDVSDHLSAGYRLDQLVDVPLQGIRRTRWSLLDLLSTEPEPIRWLIPGMIPEGLTLLVGAPKVGKSWWNLQLMISMATGKPDEIFHWGQGTEPSPSLYCALEDPQRRIHDRAHQILRGLPGLDLSAYGPGDVWLDLPPIAEGGRDQIERWIERHPNTRAIMVDVLAKVRSHPKDNAPLYQADYDSIGVLKDLADDFGIGVIVTHHDRKKGDEDFLNMVSGTKGVTGAADTILYMTRKRGSPEGSMKLESRDVEDCEFGMLFNKEQGRWHIQDRKDISDDTPGVSSRDPIAQLRRMLVARGESTVADLAKILDKDERTVRRSLMQGKQEQILGQTSTGLWYATERLDDAAE